MNSYYPSTNNNQHNNNNNNNNNNNQRQENDPNHNDQNTNSQDQNNKNSFMLEPILILAPDSTGTIWVRATHPLMSTELQNFLVSTCEPVTRPHFYNEYQMTDVSLCAAASEKMYSAAVIAQVLMRYSGLDVLPTRFQNLLRTMDGDNRLRLVLEPREEIEDDDDAGDANDGNRDRKGNNSLSVSSSSASVIVGGVRRERDEEHNNNNPNLSSVSNFQALLAKHQRKHLQDSLCYVLTSTSRFTLERVIFQIPLVPPLLKPKKIGKEEKLIFTDIVTTFSENNHNNNNNSSHHHQKKQILYKTEVRSGCLRELREAIYNKERITIDVSYDYEKDIDITPNVQHFELRDPSVLRPYQEEAVRRFLGGGKARNGIIVLPCGAGKSLTGISCAAALGKPCIVLCVNETSCLQWRDQFLRWTTLKREQISLFTGHYKDYDVKDVFITTYSMLLSSKDIGNNSNNNDNNNNQQLSEGMQLKTKFMADARKKAWGALILDEVHGAVASEYQKVLDQFRYHVSVGLTATLLREDDKIGNLRFLVGPKLFEANWLELARAGHLATVHCIEVRCPVPAPLLNLYLGVGGVTNQNSTDAVTTATTTSSSFNPNSNNSNNRKPQQHHQQQPSSNYSAALGNAQAALRKRLRIEEMNPFKIWVVQSLIAYHTNQRSPSDKIIVFCESHVAVKYYSRALGIPLLYGETPPEERACMLDHFRYNPQFNVILLSKVGDVALDLPEATVVIQIAGLGASRRQEAQRLGRILRPKPPSLFTANAFFYTLVSSDTDEALSAFSRQQWLRDQGFSFRVTNAETVMKHFENSFPKDVKRQNVFLSKAKATRNGKGGDNDQDDDDGEQPLNDDDDDDDDDDENNNIQKLNHAPCPVPTNRWVCVASQSAKHFGQKGHPTLWQVRTTTSTSSQNNKNSSSSAVWQNLPPALCSVFEDAFVNGTGLVSSASGGDFSRKKLNREQQQLYQNIMASGVHVLIPCLRAVVVFDSMEITRSNGTLYLFNEVSARQNGSLYPESALDIVTATLNNNNNSNGQNNNNNNSRQGAATNNNNNNSNLPFILQVLPNVELSCDTSVRMCQMLNADPSVFLGFKEYRKEWEEIISSRHNNNNNENNRTSAAISSSSVRQKFENEIRGIGLEKNINGNNLTTNKNTSSGESSSFQRQQLQLNEPYRITFRIRRYGGPKDHSCDIHNPSSTCVSTLIQKVSHSSNQHNSANFQQHQGRSAGHVIVH